jgi:hypothetical protein
MALQEKNAAAVEQAFLDGPGWCAKRRFGAMRRHCLQPVQFTDTGSAYDAELIHLYYSGGSAVLPAQQGGHRTVFKHA